jgi:hypothetical protein
MPTNTAMSPLAYLDLIFRVPSICRHSSAYYSIKLGPRF